MPIQKAIGKTNSFINKKNGKLAESHLQMIDQQIKLWNGNSQLPLLYWSVGVNADAVSGQGRYKSKHPHIEKNFINYINANTNNLYTLMVDAIRLKKSGIQGKSLISALTQLDTLGVNLNCRFFIRRFINLIFPDQFTTISHDLHLQKVQIQLASNNLLTSWGNSFLEQSYNTRQDIANYIQSNHRNLPKNVPVLSSQTLLYLPSLAFHVS